MIKTKNVNLQIEDRLILNNASLTINKGEFVSVIGSNGCGKSTLLKTLVKQLKPTDGEILIQGNSVASLKQKELAKIISSMSQHNKIIDDLTVMDMVSYGRLAHKSMFSFLNADDEKIIEECIQKTFLTELKNRCINSLSGGELQRVFLATSLAQEPEILILDEPTNHLDIKYQYELLTLVRNLVVENNLTIICVLHDLNQAIKFSDKIAIMENGMIKYYGAPNSIINEEVILEIFGVKSVIHYDENDMHVDILV